MQQRTVQVIDAIGSCRNLCALALTHEDRQPARHLLEAAALFLTVCALWGLVIFAALAATPQ